MSDEGLRADAARLLASLRQLLGEPKASLEALAAAYSGRCDTMILEAEAKDRLVFVGGRLVIALLRNGYELEIQMKAYFQNASAEWVHKSNREVCDANLALADPAIAELRRAGRVEFDLEKPAQSNNGAAAPQR